MDSFLKDALSAIILASWVFPVLYLALALVMSGLAALYRRMRGDQSARPPAPPRPPRRSPALAPKAAAVRLATASAARHVAPGPVARAAAPKMSRSTPRPRVAARWKSSERVTASAC
ncbi:MAG: hypothetical protein JNM76_04235 [Betaproteobacteria bacterium]|nr:hypothetical protein [Betaproteobacteria bacterium]